MKQTAVEWLWHHMMVSITRPSKEMLEQAKEMEKEQIIDAYNESFILRDKPYLTAIKYYNETYGGNK